MASVASVLLTWPFRGNHSQLTVFITRLPQLVINSHFLKMTSIFLISDGYPFRRCCRLHPLHPIQGQRLHEPSNTYSVGLVTFLRSTCFSKRKPAQVTCTSAHGNTQAHTLIIKAPIVVVVICVFHNARSASHHPPSRWFAMLGQNRSYCSCHLCFSSIMPLSEALRALDLHSSKP